MLINLIKNALKHTTAGEIVIRSSFNFVESMLVVHVQDSGCGIKEGDMKRLFTRFGKLDDPNKLNNEGIGLGLTICQAIIDANHGRI